MQVTSIGVYANIQKYSLITAMIRIIISISPTNTNCNSSVYQHGLPIDFIGIMIYLCGIELGCDGHYCSHFSCLSIQKADHNYK